LRSTNDVVDQLQVQVNELRAQLKQAAFNLARSQEETQIALKGLAEAKLELAQRRMIDALAATPSLPTSKH
jgi:hypothetical protein